MGYYTKHKIAWPDDEFGCWKCELYQQNPNWKRGIEGDNDYDDYDDLNYEEEDYR